MSSLLRVDNLCEQELCEGGVLGEEGGGGDGGAEHRDILRPGDGQAEMLIFSTQCSNFT